MTDVQAAIETAVLRIARARQETLERACEEALQGGVCGVLIYVGNDGVEHISPHPSVPYGTIHSYPYGYPDTQQETR